MNEIHNIKSRTSVNILASNYSNKHVTFNKGEYIGHLENIDEEMYSNPYEIQRPMQQVASQQRK